MLIGVETKMKIYACNALALGSRDRDDDPDPGFPGQADWGRAAPRPPEPVPAPVRGLKSVPGGFEDRDGNFIPVGRDGRPDWDGCE